MTILVTGASGTIGREMAQLLRGTPGVYAMTSRAGDVADLGLPTRQADFADRQSLQRAFAGIDTVFLLFPFVEHARDFAANAIDAARAAGVRHVVRSSGAGADVQSPYAIGRYQGEIDALIAGSGIAHTLTRPNVFMQNWVSFYSAQIKGGTLYAPSGDGGVSWIDARDIAAVNAAIVQDPAPHAGARYNLTGSEALSYSQALAQVNAAAGIDARYVPASDDAAREGMRAAGVPAWNADTLISLGQLTRDGHAAATSDAVLQITGRAPRRFADFARENAGAWTI